MYGNFNQATHGGTYGGLFRLFVCMKKRDLLQLQSKTAALL
jgi:hypothetical protein